MINKTMLIILDGYGINESKSDNAVSAANTPFIDKFKESNNAAQLITSGLAVGLPEGVMGNSEVGHLNIGAGRTVYQLNTMIDKQISNGNFDTNPAMLNAINHAKQHDSKLHLFGLLSDGNVHSYNKHLYAILKLAAKNKVKNVYLHAFMDGRDTLPHSGINFIREFINKSEEIGVGKIATIIGRYYVMDRDNRWERIEKAYKALVRGEGVQFNDPITAIQTSYDNNVTDEFIEPINIVSQSKPVATVEENDAVLFFNFRSDRAREITRSFIFNDFNHFETENFNNLKYVTFSEYDVLFNDKVEVCFRLPKLVNILAQYVSDKGIKQLRVAETEKYAHVTFFFNGGKEEPYPGEERVLVPSPKVATYDLQPEMSAYEVKDKLVEAINSDQYDLIITNFANCDMVGHTGVFDAAVKAVETVDSCLSEVIPAAQNHNFNIIVIADHGNAEQMKDAAGNIFTAHTTNPVPVMVALNDNKKINLKNGILADVAPTILKLMGLEKPEEMTGESLF